MSIKPRMTAADIGTAPVNNFDRIHRDVRSRGTLDAITQRPERGADGEIPGVAVRSVRKGIMGNVVNGADGPLGAVH